MDTIMSELTTCTWTVTLVNLVPRGVIRQIISSLAVVVWTRSLTYPFITGITCGNDFSKIEWAVENGMNYISFCSVFPSGSVDTCEIINRDIIRKARSFTNIPIFLSGGITLDNLSLLEDTGMSGIAVISGIMNANNTLESAQQYSKALHKINLTWENHLPKN